MLVSSPALHCARASRLFHTTEARLRAVGRAGIDHQFRGPGDVQFGVFDSKFNDPELLKHHVSCCPSAALPSVSSA